MEGGAGCARAAPALAPRVWRGTCQHATCPASCARTHTRTCFACAPHPHARTAACTTTTQYAYQPLDYDATYDAIRAALLEGVFGPPKGGVYSPSVQFTL
jgi:hypothetical protein